MMQERNEEEKLRLVRLTMEMMVEKGIKSLKIGYAGHIQVTPLRVKCMSTAQVAMSIIDHGVQAVPRREESWIIIAGRSIAETSVCFRLTTS